MKRVILTARASNVSTSMSSVTTTDAMMLALKQASTKECAKPRIRGDVRVSFETTLPASVLCLAFPEGEIIL